MAYKLLVSSVEAMSSAIKDTVSVILLDIPRSEEVLCGIPPSGLHVVTNITHLERVRREFPKKYVIVVRSDTHLFTWVKIDSLNKILEESLLAFQEEQMRRQSQSIPLHGMIFKTVNLAYGSFHNLFLLEGNFLRNMIPEVLSLLVDNNEAFLQKIVGETVVLSEECIGYHQFHSGDHVRETFKRLGKNLISGLRVNDVPVKTLLNRMQITTGHSFLNLCRILFKSKEVFSETIVTRADELIPRRGLGSDNNVTDLNVSDDDHYACRGLFEACRGVEQPHRVVFVWYHQFEGNVFEKYGHYIYRKMKDRGVPTSIYLIEPLRSNLVYDFGNDVVVGEVTRLKEFVIHRGITKIFFIYLPFYFYPEGSRNDLMSYAEGNNIDVYTFVGGTISHMHEYVRYPCVKKALTMGSWLKEMYQKKKVATKVFPTYLYPYLRIRPEYSPLATLRKKFSCVGRFAMEKRTQLVIDAFITLVERTGDRDLRLYVIGGGSVTSKRDMMQHIETHKVRDNILLIDWMESGELTTFLEENVDYNILASVSEGISGIVLETQALGIPSIVSRVHCVDEIIQDGYNGLTFDYGGYDAIEEHFHTNPVALVKAISIHDNINLDRLVSCLLKVYGDVALRNRLGRNCCDYMNGHYRQVNDISVSAFFDL